jgi:putative hemolysin
LDGLFVYIVGLAVLIFLSAFFSGSEAALFSLNRSQTARLAKQSPAGREIAGLLSSPRKVLVTILIGNLIVNVFSTSAATSVAVRLLGDKGVGVAFLVMSVLIMVCGEIFPKVLAINQPQRFSLFAVYPLKAFHFIFYPIRLPVARLTDGVIEFLKRRLGMARRHFSREELVTAVDIGRTQGHVGSFAYDLLSNIIEFRDTTVKEIMTPSIRVFSLPMAMNREDMEERIIQTEFSRVPVYGETADDIRGIVHIKELAAAADTVPSFDINRILRPPYYVPESTRISKLFKDLGQQRSQLALVIDEYGSYVGVVTMEDILEELVGEIHDSKEVRKEDYTLVDGDRIIVQGTMEIDEFNQVFKTDIEDEENETIAGYVIGVTGSIPREGETIDIGDLRFHIISAQPNRIRKMRVEKV